MRKSPASLVVQAIAFLTGVSALSVGLGTAVVQSSRAQSTDPDILGQWSATKDWGFVAIHAHVLPDGKVLTWGRDWDENQVDGKSTQARVWDPLSDTFVNNNILNSTTNVFCSGHAFLPDGRLLVTGGHLDDDRGLVDTTIYDHITQGWTKVQDMIARRWYPTTTTLGNGEMLVIAGTYAGYQNINQMPQIWKTTGGWRDLVDAQKLPDGTNSLKYGYYPFMFAAPNGKVFYAGPEPDTRYLDTTGTGRWIPLAHTNFNDTRDYGSAASYAPGKVLLSGGAGGDLYGPPPTATTEIIDLNAENPVWQQVESMAYPRRHHNLTVLPDGTILATGGNSAPGKYEETAPALPAELWDPATQSWSTLASMPTLRVYHSIAALLPDGRVLSAAGGQGGESTYRPSAETYSPPYLFRGPRPTVSAAPVSVGYGQAFTVQSPEAADVRRVTWVRLSSVTHAFNQNQRFNELTFTRSGNTLTVTAPANGNLAPPGHYLLYILNSDGVPSVGRVVRVGTLAPAGDFSGDRKSELVWRNGSTGQNSLWLMNNTTFTQSVALPAVSDPNWLITGSGDFDNDGRPDLLWRNQATGENTLWLMNGTTYRTKVTLPLVATAWQVGGVGDFDGDGRPDIFWRNPSTGQVSAWLMNGIQYAVSRALPSVGDANWQLVAAGQFNNDAQADLLWRHKQTGANSVWLMSGTALAQSVALPAVSTVWRIGAAGDYNGDGKADIVWRDTTTGANAVWLMNGTAFAQSVGLSAVGAGWQLSGPR